MSQIKDKFSEFLNKLFENDPFRCDDALDGYDILDLKVNDRSINATYQFYSIKDTDFDKEFILFKTESIFHPNFPKGLKKCIIQENFTWTSRQKCMGLDVYDVDFEHINLDVKTVYWENPELSEEIIDKAIEHFDTFLIGKSLFELTTQNNMIMSDFIPARIMKRMENSIKEYLKG